MEIFLHFQASIRHCRLLLSGAGGIVAQLCLLVSASLLHGELYNWHQDHSVAHTCNAKRAMEFYILYLICKKLREKNASSFKTERDLGKYSIFGNILFAHALVVHFVCNLHIGLPYAVLAFKNFLLDVTCNAFDKQYHGLDIPNGNYHVVASNLRQQMAQAATRITNRTKDRQFHITVLNHLGRCLSKPRTPRFISGAFDILTLEGNRIRHFFAKKMLNAQTNQLLLDEYSSRIDPRRGDNTTQAVLANNVSCERFVSGGVWTLCQATGKAGNVVFSDIPTNTVLGEFELDGELRVIRVGNFSYCNMTFGALRSRIKRLDEKSLIVPPNMWGDHNTPPNDHNLVLVKAIEKIERQDTKRTKIVQDGGTVENGVSYEKAKSRYVVRKSVAKGNGKSKQITLGAAWKTVDDANKASLTARDWLKKNEHTITEDNYKEMIQELKRVTNQFIL